MLGAKQPSVSESADTDNMLRVRRKLKSLHPWWHYWVPNHAYNITTPSPAVEQLASALCKPWFSTLVAPENHFQCLGHIPDQWKQISPGRSQASQAIPKCRKFWEPSFKPLSVGYSVSSRKKKKKMFFLCSSFRLKILLFSQIKLISKKWWKDQNQFVFSSALIHPSVKHS